MLKNFTKASVTKAENAEKLAAINTDLLGLLDKGGVSALDMAKQWRIDAAALVREAVQDEFLLTDPTPLFVETRTGVQGDTYEFEKLVNTLRAIEYSPGASPTAFTPRKAKYGIKTAQWEIPFGIELKKIMSRQYSVGDIAVMAAQAKVRHYQNFVLTAINAACGASVVDQRGRLVRTAAAGSAVAKAELDAAIRRIISATGAAATIYASRFAIDPIYDAGATLGGFLSQKELQDRGVLGGYRGAAIVEMKDEFNMFYQSFANASNIPLEKLIFISSGKPGAIMLERDMAALQYEELNVREAMWNSSIRMDHGILVHTPWAFHVIALV